MVIRNSAANLAGMLITILVQAGIAFGGYRLAGAEQFGLIALYNVVLVGAGIFDVGLGQAVVREVSRQRASAGGICPPAVAFSATLLYSALALMIVIGVWAASPFLARHWLSSGSIDYQQVQSALVLLGIGVGIQRLRGAFQAVLEGLEHQILVNLLVTAAGVSRLCLGLGALIFVAPTAHAFFVSQIFASLIETGLFAIAVLRRVPGVMHPRSFDGRVLRHTSRFALVNMLATASGTIIQIADSLIVSFMAPLSVYGKYALVSTLCAGMVRLGTPFGSAFYPRMVMLIEERDTVAVERTFYVFTQATYAVLLSASIALIIFGDWTLLLFSGDAALARDFAPVLAMLAIAYALSGLSRPCHSLQLAQGKPETALWINLATGLCYLPAALIFFPALGVITPALGLAAGNLLAFILFMRLGPSRYLGGGARPWVLQSVLPQLAAIVSAGLIVRLVLPQNVDPPVAFICIAFACTCSLLAALAVSRALRPLITSQSHRVLAAFRNRDHASV